MNEHLYNLNILISALQNNDFENLKYLDINKLIRLMLDARQPKEFLIHQYVDSQPDGFLSNKVKQTSEFEIVEEDCGDCFKVIEKSAYDQLQKDWQEADIIYSHARHLLYKAADFLADKNSELAIEIADFLKGRSL